MHPAMCVFDQCMTYPIWHRRVTQFRNETLRKGPADDGPFRWTLSPRALCERTPNHSYAVTRCTIASVPSRIVTPKHVSVPAPSSAKSIMTTSVSPPIVRSVDPPTDWFGIYMAGSAFRTAASPGPVIHVFDFDTTSGPVLKIPGGIATDFRGGSVSSAAWIAALLSAADFVGEAPKSVMGADPGGGIHGNPTCSATVADVAAAKLTQPPRQTSSGRSTSPRRGTRPGPRTSRRQRSVRS